VTEHTAAMMQIERNASVKYLMEYLS
jgi:hypothetical protein